MSDDPVPRPTFTIRPSRGWLPDHPRELWAFRELLRRFAARDITLRYRQTALGVTWVVLQPLLGAGILSFVFGNVADLPGPAGMPYFVFSFAGMVGWTAFSQTLTRSSGSLVANAAMVQKVFFPRLLLPFSTVVSTLVDVAVSLGLMGVLMAIYGVWPGWSILALPLWFAALFVVALGVGLAAAALVVRYRDVGQVLPVMVQLLLFASPVAYALDVVPEGARWLFELNPLSGLLEGLRWSLLGTPAPSLGLAIYAVAASVAVLAVGVAIFSRMERQFADVI